MVYNSEHSVHEEQANALHQQLKLTQEENRRLQQQLIQKSKNSSETHDADSQQKNMEIVSSLAIRLDFFTKKTRMYCAFINLKDSLKKKYIASQEENKKLKKEMTEKSEKLYKEYTLGT